MMSSQLALGIGLKPTVNFSGFIPGPNGEALSRLLTGTDPFIYLWGESGSCKTHLLQASCHQQDESGGTCAYIPLAQTSELEPGILEGLEALDLVCLDDLEKVAGNPAWEIALFNLFNQLRECDARLLITANSAPAGVDIRLPDLASRLTWGPCYHLLPLDDDGRLILLTQLSQQRGLELSQDTASYLLQRIPRDISSITGLLEQLDQASLAAKRKLTIPFVREVLGL
ncbi:MAG: DnaA regulatory inactivator Hda [Gammaproteobacteria bacterium]|nr:DnaA regulatory inactivator Hda [Gammaproteobacteria bacterium]